MFKNGGFLAQNIMKSSTVVNVTGASLVVLGIATVLSVGAGCRDFVSDVNSNDTSERTGFVNPNLNVFDMYKDERPSLLYGPAFEDDRFMYLYGPAM